MRQVLRLAICAGITSVTLGLVYLSSSGDQIDASETADDFATLRSPDTSDFPVELRLLTGSYVEGEQAEVALVNLETAEPSFYSGDDTGLVLAASFEDQGQILVSAAVEGSDNGGFPASGYSLSLFADGLGEPDFESFFGLREGRGLPRGFLTPDGDRIWIVTKEESAQTAVLRELSSGSEVTSVDIPDRVRPEGATELGLVVASYEETETAPDVEASVTLVGNDGSLQALGHGEVLAVLDSGAIIVRCQDLPVRCTLSVGDEDVELDLPEGGRWTSPGGYAIPTLSRPLSTVSPDGSGVLISRQHEGDGHNVPSTLYRLDFETGELTEIASQDDIFRLATWSRDGGWIVTIAGSDIVLYDWCTPGNSVTLPDAIPEGHRVLAAG